MIEALLLTLICALGFRLRGSSLLEGNSISRPIKLVIWGLSIGLPVAFFYSNPWFLLVTLAAMGTASFANVQHTENMGRDASGVMQVTDYNYFLTKVAIRGLIHTLPLALVISTIYWFFTGDINHWLVIFGLSGTLFPAILLLSRLIPSQVRNFEQGHALGEFLFGGLTGLALYLSIFLNNG